MSHASNPVVKVRQATARDAEVLARLLAEMDDEQLPPDPAPDIERMRDILAGMAAYPYFRAYLVSENGEPVGSFSLMIFSSPSHGGASQAMLDAVVVTRSRRGSGIGQAMIREALDIASAAGCYKMTLSSNLKRLDAHRFYEQLGFKQHGVSFSIPLNGAIA
jgi:GNAT superfamily N-acetyltransferase